MNIKKIAGLLVFALGLGLLFTSHYIQGEVNQGTARLEKAQKTVDKSSSLFSVNPVSKQVGGVVTGAAQKKLNQYAAQAAYYQQVADNLEIGGFISLGLGALLFLWGFKKPTS
jgi:Na+/phosphate symporter